MMETKFDSLSDFRLRATLLGIMLSIFAIIIGLVVCLIYYQKTAIFLWELSALVLLGSSYFLLKKYPHTLKYILIINYFFLVWVVFIVKTIGYNDYVAMWYPPIAMSAIILAGYTIGGTITLVSITLALVAYHSSASLHSLITIALSILSAAFFGAIVNKKLIEFAAENKKISLYFQNLSITDPLTKLYNRRYFFEKLHETFSLAKRKRRPIALLYLDLDHFKSINDTYGHKKGDEILISFANILKKNLRSYDTVARIGGEEIAVLIYDEPYDKVLKIAQKIKNTVQTIPIANKKFLTTSIGITYKIPSEIDTVDSLFIESDKALYRAKELGRNRVEVYENDH